MNLKSLHTFWHANAKTLHFQTKRHYVHGAHVVKKSFALDSWPFPLQMDDGPFLGTQSNSLRFIIPLI